MYSVKNACKLQPKALEINIGDQIERLDQIMRGTCGEEYFLKLFVTGGMKTPANDFLSFLCKRDRFS